MAGKRAKDPSYALPTPAFLADVAKDLEAGKIAAPQATQSVLSGVKVSMMDTGALPGIVQGVIAANAAVATDLKNGKQSALQYLIGQAMRESKGKANPQELARLIKQELGV